MRVKSGLKERQSAPSEQYLFEKGNFMPWLELLKDLYVGTPDMPPLPSFEATQSSSKSATGGEGILYYCPSYIPIVQW